MLIDLYEFLETHITSKYKDKLIILDNASSHRNDKIKELVNKNNSETPKIILSKLLYIPKLGFLIFFPFIFINIK